MSGEGECVYCPVDHALDELRCNIRPPARVEPDNDGVAASWVAHHAKRMDVSVDEVAHWIHCLVLIENSHPCNGFRSKLGTVVV